MKQMIINELQYLMVIKINHEKNYKYHQKKGTFLTNKLNENNDDNWWYVFVFNCFIC